MFHQKFQYIFVILKGNKLGFVLKLKRGRVCKYFLKIYNSCLHNIWILRSGSITCPRVSYPKQKDNRKSCKAHMLKYFAKLTIGRLHFLNVLTVPCLSVFLKQFEGGGVYTLKHRRCRKPCRLLWIYFVRNPPLINPGLK